MITLRSPAKINLFLRVLSKRIDGYHELASLFQTIGLFDHIQINPSTFDQFTCSNPTIPTDASNLILKAVSIFRQKTGINTPLTIHLDKNIPVEAGLGGGSSNAATTLWGLNQLTGSPAPLSTLKEWAAEIGSDVPFFLSEGTAYCTGCGEKVQNLSPLPMTNLWLLKPASGLSTAKVYQALDLNNCAKNDPNDLLSAFIDGRPTYINDLEKTAFLLAPELKDLKNALQDETNRVLMSGSGTCFFIINGKALPLLPKGFFQATAPFVNRTENMWY